MLEYEVIWGHIDILVVAVRRLSRRWKVKTLLAGPSPTSPVRRRLPTPLFPTKKKGEAVFREHCKDIRALVREDRPLEFAARDDWRPLRDFPGVEEPDNLFRQ